MVNAVKHYSVIFFGTPDFACTTLHALHGDPAFNVSMVITQPDKPVGRKKEMLPPPVKSMAIELNIPVFQSQNINLDFTSIPRHMYFPPDFFVVAAFGQILSPTLLSVPKIAPVNVHASLLPKWRGASPVQHSIMRGDDTTGVTIQQMREGIDMGPILAQESIRIRHRETSATLTKRLSQIGARLLVRTLKRPLSPRPQNEEDATYCAKLTRETGIVDPDNMTAEEIDRMVRALSPWPGVKNDGIKIVETSLIPCKDAIGITCANDTVLYVVKLQSPGKKVLTGREWERGLHN